MKSALLLRWIASLSASIVSQLKSAGKTSNNFVSSIVAWMNNDSALQPHKIDKRSGEKRKTTTFCETEVTIKKFIILEVHIWRWKTFSGAQSQPEHTCTEKKNSPSQPSSRKAVFVSAFKIMKIQNDCVGHVTDMRTESNPWQKKRSDKRFFFSIVLSVLSFYVSKVLKINAFQLESTKIESKILQKNNLDFLCDADFQ